MSRLMGFIHDRLGADGDRIDYFCEENVPAHRYVGIHRLSFPLLLLRHAALAARAGDKYDVINVHEPSAAAITVLKRAAGSPAVVVTSHGLERRGWELALEEGRLGRASPGLKTRLTHPLITLWQADLALKQADHIFCLNGEDREFLAERFGIPRKRVTRIYPGADELYARTADCRNYLKPVQRLLFAGAWRKNKGIEDLVPAFTMLAARYPMLRLTILGAGIPAAPILETFHESLRPRIDCVTASDEADTARVFASADLYLLPSLFEGTPLTLIEAMMSGLPIVTTETCGMRDVIQSGGNGLLVPIRSSQAIVNAVSGLMADVDLRARLGRAARADAMRRYTWAAAADPVRRAYQDLVRDRPCP
jgi:glycosyltransferase involved in cell wall biosynthesis